MFWAESQATWGATLNRHRRGLTVVVRTIGDPMAMLPAIQAQVAAVDPNRPLIDALPMRSLVARSAEVQRFSMLLLGLFASVGLVLAAAGVYGVMAYTVAANRREMGIRLALGARPRSLLAQVLRTGFMMAAAGAAIGLVAAWMLDDVFAAQLFQTPPRDVLTFASVAVLLLDDSARRLLRPSPPRRPGRSDRGAARVVGARGQTREKSRERREREDGGRPSQRVQHEGTETNGGARRLSRCTTVRQSLATARTVTVRLTR